MLLFAAQFELETLSEALLAHGEAEDPLLPVAELTRLLELEVNVLPAQGVIVGRLGESRRMLSIDLASGEARSGPVGISIGPGDSATSPTDIYIRASLLEQLLPVSIKVDADNLLLTITAREKLPLQSRRERSERLLRLGDALSAERTTLLVESPYRWLSYPAFDVSADLGGDSERVGLHRRFEARFAADMLRTNVTGFFGTDDRGRRSSARLRAERHSLSGDLFGPLHATYAAIGDTYTPALALGPRSISGAGAQISTAPLDQLSVFDRITLRGELPLGYDVELYVNEILRAGQNAAPQGRYEFLDIPLVRGVNVIRIVSYGPRGERNEETRIINVGGGQVQQGRTVLDAGVVWQERPVIDLDRGTQLNFEMGRGRLRAVFSLAHGLSPSLTAQAGGAIYSDQLGRTRRLLSGSFRTSLGGFAVQADHAHDFMTGRATSLSLAGRIAGIPAVARHVEYAAAFADENVAYFDIARPMRRYSELTFDMTVPFLAKTRLPISGRFERVQFTDGGLTWVARGRTSLSVANTLVAVGADYTLRTQPGFSSEQLTGTVAASRLVDYKWQLRASADFELAPDNRMRALALTADRALSDRQSFRLGFAKSFGEFRDLTAHAGLSAHFPFGDATLTGDYATEQKRWRIGLQLSVGLVFDPIARTYRLSLPGPANGASAAIQAFRDDNSNGVPDRGEAPIEGLVLVGPAGPARTNASGRAFVTGLGQGPSGMLQVDASKVDTVFDSAPAATVSFTPRAGDVLKIYYPFVPTSEIAATIQLRQREGSMIGLAAVRIRLVANTGKLYQGTTEFDGTAVFEQVPPGSYRLELDPEQARLLGMSFASPIQVEVVPNGRLIRVTAEVIFDREREQ